MPKGGLNNIKVQLVPLMIFMPLKINGLFIVKKIPKFELVRVKTKQEGKNKNNTNFMFLELIKTSCTKQKYVYFTILRQLL